MRELIIKRSNLKDEYILEVTGYVPIELEEDFEQMAEKFASEEYLLIEDIYKEVIAFQKYQKRRNRLIIKYEISSKSEDMDEELIDEFGAIRTVTLYIQVRRTFAKWIEELF